jgi:arginyl-tRNA synthetase
MYSAVATVKQLREEFPQSLDKESAKNVDLGDLVLLYKAAKECFDNNNDFKTRVREGVVRLQAGNVDWWKP